MSTEHDIYRIRREQAILLSLYYHDSLILMDTVENEIVEVKN